jgi:hypothetical protein
MWSQQLFSIQPEGNKIAPDKGSPNHFRKPLVVVFVPVRVEKCKTQMQIRSVIA